MRAVLVLEDGATWVGQAIGASGETHGEVVFTTGMTGYQETLTDASYCGEIVTMTYPLIGNCGVNKEDFENKRPYARGFIVSEIADEPSNWRSTGKLQDFLAMHGVVGIAGIDTRALTRSLRSHGTMKGAIATGDSIDLDALRKRVALAPHISQEDLVAKVTTDSAYLHHAGKGPHVVVVDLGAKQSILHSLVQRDCTVTVVPAYSTVDSIMAMQPEGVLLSNGPGDPQRVTQTIETARNLIGQIPLFGICLGHQVLSLAMGASTYKLKYGHRGANHPVQDVSTGRVYITSQNHGFAVEESTLTNNVFVTHRNLNDGTIEGLRHKTFPVFSVQYHPEASPGPQDNCYLFDEFMKDLQPSCTPSVSAN